MPISLLAHKIILYSCLSISLVGNSLLIHLVLHAQSAVMGRYRWLLVIFGLTDIATSCFHSFVVPIATGAPYGFALFSHTVLYWSEPARLAMNLILVALFMEPFVLLSFHFIYRYLALWKPSSLHVHSGKCALLFILLNTLFIGITVKSFADIWLTSKTESFFNAQLLSEYGINVLANTRPGYFAINFKKGPESQSPWNWAVIGAVMQVTVPSGICIAICFVCTFLILRGFSTKTLKIRFRHLQIQLFHALLLQFAVPMVLVCLPFSVSIFLPLMGVNIGQLANVCGLAFEFYPALDPFIVIFAIPRFKRILHDKFRRVTVERFRHNEIREQTRLQHYWGMIVRRDTVSVADISIRPQRQSGV